MDFGILGPLEVHVGGRPVEVGKPKQQSLLAVLLLHANQAVSVHRLAEDLWDRNPPSDLTGALQAHVSRLRSRLAAHGGPPVAFTRPPGYRIDVEPDTLDAVRFGALSRAGRMALVEGRPEQALETLASALGLWRGAPLAELGLGPLARADIAKLDDQRLSALEDLAEAELALGRYRPALERLDALVVEHPLRERFWAQRMTALYRSGRQAEALRAYGHVRRLLAEELGVHPGPELQALEAAILEQRLGDETPPPPMGTGAAPWVPPGNGSRRSNLPASLTSFVGRSAERAEVATLLGRRRLVTLTGFGGAGKTRLALEVATDLEATLPDGAWFVDLSMTVNEVTVGRALATTLGVPEQLNRSEIDVIADAVNARNLLVVLDNCEHVAAAAAGLVTALLPRCPGLRVLATSREVLGAAGEVWFSVPPLAAPLLTDPLEAVARSEAVQLFVDRASLVRRDFCLSAANAAAVASICSRLDGIPLAIELAAARLSVLSAQQIDLRLSDRFRLLADESSGRPDRHKTLAATMEWSDSLLTPAERVLLWRFSVFAGGFGLDAAEAVTAGGVIEADGVLDGLARLVARSLVVADTSGTEARYRLLETIRQHGADRLSASGEMPSVRARQASWCLGLAEQSEPHLGGGDQEAWFDRLSIEHDNLRAALSWAVEQGDGELVLRLAGALTMFWRVRGHVAEGREWLRTALALPSAVSAPARAKALWGVGFMATMMYDHAAAVPALEESIALYRQLRDDTGIARALLVLGNGRRFTDGSLVALVLLDEAVSLARSAGDRWSLVHGLSLAAAVRLEEGHLDETEGMLDETLALVREARDLQGARMALYALGQLRMTQGRLSDAAEAFEEGLRVARQLQEPFAVSSLAASLAEVYRATGRHSRADRLLDEALAVAGTAGPVARIDGLCGKGSLALARGDPAGARRAFGEALASANRARSRSIMALLGLAESAYRLGDAAESRRALDEALRLADTMGSRKGRACVLEILGRMAADGGDDDDAWARYQQALTVFRQVGDVGAMARCVGAIGSLALRRSVPEGVALVAAGRTVREASGEVFTDWDEMAYEADVAAAGLALPEGRLEAALEAGRALSVDAAAEQALRLQGPTPRAPV